MIKKSFRNPFVLIAAAAIILLVTIFATQTNNRSLVLASSALSSNPACPPHDPNKPQDWINYHGVTDNRSLCYHNHEHGDNPSAAYRALGNLFRGFIRIAGGTISYPWATPKENEFPKHNFQKWIVLTNLPCEPIATWHRCFSDIALQVHFDGNSANCGRFHSFTLLASAVNANGSGGFDEDSRGYVLTGGHYDTGGLRVDGVDVPCATDSFQNPIGCQLSHCGLRIHSPANPVNEPNRLPHDITWLGTTRRAQVGIISHDAFGPTDASDLTRINITCPAFDCQFNSSQRAIYQLHLNSLLATDGDQQRFDPDGNGWIENYSGWTNRWGNPVDSGCITPGPDCIPLKINNWPLTNHFSYSQPGNLHTEHDVAPPSPIRFPN